ncbi:MAG TPA: cytochrome c3 family protein [Prolixibacteraceae bacterium]|nr:cytochrome c3 family protein [Prolixibacteraceae bacterium]
MRKIILLRHFSLRLKTFISLVFISIFLICGNPLLANSSNDKNEAISDIHSHVEIQRGERFFKGLLPKDRKFEACVSCHILSQPDTMNWNPSAIDIAVKFAGKDFSEFQSAVMQPSGKKMEASHKDFKIEEEDLKTVKLYLDELAITGPPKEGPTINQIVIFLFLGIFMAFALLDLIFFHKIKYRFVPVLVLLISLVFQVKMVTEAAVNLGRSQNYAPNQPIKFSHKVHAGDNQIDCKYCHHTAEFGKSAGIPAMELCMNCHVLVREGTHSGKFEIAKVIEANETKKPVEWTRIHNLPDHVFFSHAQHVGIAKVDCKQCHGQVQEMDIMRQNSDLSMGWCINCHRDTKVNFKDNAYYDNYMKLHDDLKSGKIDTIRAVDIGANDCMRCHY